MASQSRSQSRMPAAERHFALVLALLWTDRGLTRDQIFAQIPGYEHSKDPQVDPKTVERMFERDKKALEEIGILVEVEHDLESRDGQGEYRYFIPKGSFKLPEEVTFTPQEIVLLNLAGKVWQGESLAHDVNRALTKIRGLGLETASPVIGFAPKLVIHDRIYRSLQQGIEQQVLVKFLYQKPVSPEAELRTVVPLAVIAFRDHWLLYSWDTVRQDYRTFLLSRITGDVTVTETPAEHRIDEPENQAIASWQQLWDSNLARVQVQEGSLAQAQLMRRAVVDGNQFILNFLDLHILADELAGLGPEVFVLSPPELQDAVIQRLQHVFDEHSEEAS